MQVGCVSKKETNNWGKAKKDVLAQAYGKKLKNPKEWAITSQDWNPMPKLKTQVDSLHNIDLEKKLIKTMQKSSETISGKWMGIDNAAGSDANIDKDGTITTSTLTLGDITALDDGEIMYYDGSNATPHPPMMYTEIISYEAWEDGYKKVNIGEIKTFEGKSWVCTDIDMIISNKEYKVSYKLVDGQETKPWKVEGVFNADTPLTKKAEWPPPDYGATPTPNPAPIRGERAKLFEQFK